MLPNSYSLRLLSQRIMEEGEECYCGTIEQCEYTQKLCNLYGCTIKRVQFDTHISTHSAD